MDDNDDNDELKDLPLEDAKELRAFVQKRRWFEGKLKILEELPPIYPFLHPVLVALKSDTAAKTNTNTNTNTSTDLYTNGTALNHDTADDPFTREGSATSPWRLPTPRQIREWQLQRDKIEEDVLEFDGGDLGRIKQKTRAVTVLPLTPPSTHLVSITLDLIVLIDRLLKLLRHRARLLELTSLRLQWDAIRWEVIMETKKIRAEVRSIVRDKGRWTASGRASTPTLIATLAATSAKMSTSTSLPTLTSSSSLKPATSTSLTSASMRTSSTASQVDGPEHATSLTPLTPPQLLTPMTASRPLLNDDAHLATSDHSTPYEPITPPRTSVSIMSSNTSESDVPMNGTHKSTPKVAIPDLSSTSLSKSTSASSSAPTRSPPRFSTPKRSLHIPLLHSQLVNVRIRQQNIASTQIARSGALLDRMIDVAGPLKGLGNVAGPNGDMSVGGGGSANGGEGAVPDELLDVQDDLEADVRKLGEQVAWCKELENHWKMAEAHHSASLHATHLAEQVMHDLRSSLTQLSIKDRHRALLDTLEEARSHLPAPIDSTFPNPSHRSYPENDEHNLHVVNDLRAAYTHAEETIRETRLGAEWYGQIIKARGKLLDQRDLSSTCLKRSLVTLDQLENGENDIRRPDMDEPQSLGDDHSPWLKQVQRWQIEAAEQLDEAAQLRQRTFLTLQQYNNAIKVPHNLRATELPSPEDGLSDEVDQISDQLDETIQNLIGAKKKVAQDVPILEIVDEILHAEIDIKASMINLTDEVERMMIRCAWPSSMGGSNEDVEVKEISARADRNRQRFKAEIAARISAFDHLLRSQDRALPRLRTHLSKIELRLTEQQTILDRSVDLMQRIRAQTIIATTIHREGSGLLQCLNQAQEQVDALVERYRQSGDGQISERLFERPDALKTQVATWHSTLVGRLPFVSDYPEDVALTESIHLELLPLTSTVTPLPPPEPDALAAPADHDLNRSHVDAGAIDRRVRDASNALAIQLNSALSRYEATCSHLAYIGWADRCKVSAEGIDDALNRWHATQTDVTNEMERIERSTMSSADSDGVDQNIENMIARTLERIEGDGKSLSTALHTMQATVSEETTRFDNRHAEITMWISAAATAKDAVDDAVGEANILVESVNSFKARLAAQRVSAPVSESADVFGPGAVSTIGSEIQSESQPSIEHTDLIEELLADHNQPQKPSTPRDSAPATTVFRPGSATPFRIASRLPRLTGSLPRATIRAASNPVINGLPDGDGSPFASTTLAQSIGSQPRGSYGNGYSYGHFNVNVNGLNECLRAASDTAPPVRMSSWKGSTGIPRPRKESLGSASPIIHQDRERDGQIHSRQSSMGISTPIPRSRTSSLSTVRDGAETRSTSISGASNGRRSRQSSIPPKSSGRVSTSSSLRFDNLSTSTSAYKRMSSRSASGSGPAVGVAPQRDREHAHDRVELEAKREYVAVRGNRLDVAVASIVNDLDVHVPVRPVGLSSVDDAWEDQCGQYWIGAEGRAKLCFCRILRSRTVMVRVGGGWVELSKFLLEHFAGTVGALQTPLGFTDLSEVEHVSISGEGVAGDNGDSESQRGPLPPSLSNLSLASIASVLSSGKSGMSEGTSRLPLSASSTPIASAAWTASNGTTMPMTATNPLTPPRSKIPKSISAQSLASNSPLGNMNLNSNSNGIASGGAGAGGSPLAAFQFIRRASESPSVREREKERFHGRRSILGKE